MFLHVCHRASGEMPHYCHAVLHQRSKDGISSAGKGYASVMGWLLLASLPRTGWRPRVTRRKPTPQRAFSSQSGAVRCFPRHQSQANWAPAGDSAAS